MRQLLWYVLLLIMFNILLGGTGFLLKSYPFIDLYLADTVILSLLFSVISAVTLAIFFRGQSGEPESRTLYSLVSISLKFLLDMILALIWFFVLKKTTLTYVFEFFVLYLTLTVFTIFIILKVLKNRSL
jgi:hypothetical protein